MERGPPPPTMRNDRFRMYPVQLSAPNFSLNALLRPKACLACRLAHASCDRAQPCGRCVRTGRADTCQPPPQRKRGRPRKDHSAEDATTTTATTATSAATNGSGSGSGNLNVSPPAFGSPQFGGSHPVPHHITPGPAQPPRPAQAEQGAGWVDAGSTLAGGAPAKRRRVELERNLRDGVGRHHHHHHHHHQVESNPDADEAAEADFHSDEADSDGDDYDQVYFESVNAHLHPPPPTTTSHSSHSSHSSTLSQPRRGRGTSEEQGAGAGEGAGEAQGGLNMVKSLLLLLVDEVREMKREFGQVRGEVATLRAWQGGVDDRLAALAAVNEATRAKMENERSKARHMQHVLKRLLDTSTPTSSSMPSTMSSVSSMPMSTVFGDHGQQPAAGVRSPPFMYSSPVVPSAYLAQRITPMLPFLKDYDFSTTPFVLDDISKPFFAARMKEVETFEEMESPVILFSSPSMCALLNYRVDELQGQPIRLVTRPAIACYAAFTIRILARSESPVGEVFTLNAVWAAKDRSLRLLTRHQFLYGPRRMTNWHFAVVDAVLEENVPVPPSPKGMILQDVRLRVEAWRKAVETAHPREKAALLAVVNAVDISAPTPQKMLTYFANYTPPPPPRPTPSPLPSSSSSSSSSSPSSASSQSSSPVDAHSATATAVVEEGHDQYQTTSSANGPSASEQRREAELAEMVHALYDDQSQPQPHESVHQQPAEMPATPSDPWLEFRGLASPTWL